MCQGEGREGSRRGLVLMLKREPAILVFLHPEGHDPRNWKTKKKKCFLFFCFRHDLFVWDAVVSFFVAELYFQNNAHLWFLLSLVRSFQHCLQPDHQ